MKNCVVGEVVPGVVHPVEQRPERELPEADIRNGCSVCRKVKLRTAEWDPQRQSRSERERNPRRLISPEY